MLTELLPPVPIVAEEPRTPTSTVRIANELLEYAHIVCAHTKGRGGKPLRIVDYLDAILRPRITRDHAEIMERIANEHGGQRRQRGKS